MRQSVIKIVIKSKLHNHKPLTTNLELELIGAYSKMVTFDSLNTRFGLYNLDGRNIVCASLNLLNTQKHVHLMNCLSTITHERETLIAPITSSYVSLSNFCLFSLYCHLEVRRKFYCISLYLVVELV